jgi:hypothetical protein
VLLPSDKDVPEPAYVVVRGDAVKGIADEIDLEWRGAGKRRPVVFGSDPRVALDACRIKAGVLNGTIDFEPEEEEIPVSRRSVLSAFDQLLVKTGATSKQARPKEAPPHHSRNTLPL